MGKPSKGKGKNGGWSQPPTTNGHGYPSGGYGADSDSWRKSDDSWRPGLRQTDDDWRPGLRQTDNDWRRSDDWRRPQDDRSAWKTDKDSGKSNGKGRDTKGQDEKGKGKGRDTKGEEKGKGRETKGDGKGKGGEPPPKSPKTAPGMRDVPKATDALAPAKSNPLSRTSNTTRAHLTEAQFADLPISAPAKKAIATVLGYTTMTKCQSESIPVSLRGNDVLCKAKTGTGKTLAFLIPVADQAAAIPPAQRRGFISALFISPTRELAQQIADEGKQLISFMPLKIMVIFGGTNMSKDLSAFRNEMPDLLVATPGRLNDHLENHGLQKSMQKLKNLVFDEADQLLEMGFRPAITAMLGMLPPKASRQTLLFSATMPDDVMGIARFALRDNFDHVDCVGAEVNTHQHVQQQIVVSPMQQQFEELALILREGMQVPGYKIIVFFVTARTTQLFAELFNKVGFEVLEIHSRKSQSHRTKTSEIFRNQESKIMFTSDVSARGMDYPDVTCAVQVGLPTDRAQYIHRLGRTARAGKGGGGVLLLADFEDCFLREIKDLPTQKRAAASQKDVAQYQGQMKRALSALPHETISMAYQAWLGFYNSHLRKLRWSQEELVEYANYWACEVCGCKEPPSLQAKTVGKMGLKGVKGLLIEGRGGVPHREPKDQGGRGGGKGRPLDEKAQVALLGGPGAKPPYPEGGKGGRKGKGGSSNDPPKHQATPPSPKQFGRDRGGLRIQQPRPGF